MKLHRPLTLTIILVCIIALLIVPGACGRSRGGYEESGSNDQQPAPQGEHSSLSVGSSSESQTATLTMASPERFVPVIQEAARLLNESLYQDSGNHFHLELSTYNDEDYAVHRQRFNTMFMAGEGYDLFIVDRHPLWNYASNGMLANIYDMIDNDPSVNRNDFFTNVLEAFEYQGQLISIPIKFGFTYVGINSTLPQVFVDRFAQYETISYESLLNLYHDLKLTHPGEYDHLIFAAGGLLSSHRLFEFAINDYINIDTRTANITDTQFVDFLEAFRLAENHIGNNIDNIIALGGMNPVKPRHITDNRTNYVVFNTVSSSLNPWEALFDLDDPPFINYIPATDSKGRLMIDNSDGFHASANQSIAVSAGADQALAWELIKGIIAFVSGTEIRHSVSTLRYFIGPYTLMTSIKTENFAEYAERSFERVFDRQTDLLPYVGQRRPGAREQQVSNAIARLERYNAMPIVQRPYLPPMWDILRDLLDGVITPQDAAQQFQNFISLWLIE